MGRRPIKSESVDMGAVGSCVPRDGASGVDRKLDVVQANDKIDGVVGLGYGGSTPRWWSDAEVLEIYCPCRRRGLCPECSLRHGEQDVRRYRCVGHRRRGKVWGL